MNHVPVPGLAKEVQGLERLALEAELCAWLVLERAARVAHDVHRLVCGDRLLNRLQPSRGPLRVGNTKKRKGQGP
eukprot:CAMPEP_0170179140 /NCGR_PEP_ID=MMETSP0040_2-20121228/16264_1 /TAXON_ID=641309 /ORGANISM="Lotharella oceanica, Strain CCMP622" /LENGTH=74 /DNA_ID=CAMNT_0010422987 /DNA_START=148 /DNA_END=372 /DNA_ORIENTATION=-